jgi:beta-glucosidase
MLGLVYLTIHRPVAGPLGRHPLGGRNWEGFSPDPYLTGVAMKLTVGGMQDTGVQAVSKHFIGNEQETQRTAAIDANGTTILAISANVDDRTLHELYLWPFADAVKAGSASVMCSYNRVNETYACENSPLLNGILKSELGFRGYVMSDFFATHSGVTAIEGGLDMDMPGATDQASIVTGETYFGINIVQAVGNGSLSISRVDDMVRRIMTPYFLLGQDQEYPTVDPSSLIVLATQYNVSLPIPQVPARDVRGDHEKIIRELGAAGSVLLKNVNSTLPLRSPRTIGVFGNDAADLTAGLTDLDHGSSLPFAIGTLDIGGGSGSGRHTSIVPPLEAIKARALLTGGRVEYILDNGVLAANDFRSIYPTPDVCLVFLKTYASEGVDRTSFEADWDSALVVNNVAAKCPNTIVIIHSAGVNTMPWASNPNVKAIVAAHYPGEQIGNSIVDILWGDVNPSGKLPYTIPVHEADYDIPIVNITDITSPNAWQDNFTEGQFIDYRHFDAHNITPLYEFGFGLSYTTFNFSSSLTAQVLAQNVSNMPDSSLRVSLGGNPDLWTRLVTATVTVSNSGTVEGSTVVQLYLSLPLDSVPIGTPFKVLRGFEKIPLNPGQEKLVSFDLTRRDLSYWDTRSQEWLLPKGPIIIHAAFSSRDLRSQATVQLIQ